MGNNYHYLSDRDRDILNFLWKYKVATTAMLYHKFFESVACRTAYYVLQRLRKYGYVQVRTNEYGQSPLWTLEKKGFLVVRYDLPELRAEGFKSENREHDFLCSALQLGDFLKKAPEDLEITTEQELRTYHPEFLPSYIPNVEWHRPDGYWYFKNGKNIKLISLEVELNQKYRGYYGGYSIFYDAFPREHRVLWIVKTIHQAKRILESMYEYEPEYKIHNFILLKDFYKNGWNTKIRGVVDDGKTILNLMEENCQEIADKTGISCFPTYMTDRRLSYQIYSENRKEDWSPKEQQYAYGVVKTMKSNIEQNNAP